MKKFSLQDCGCYVDGLHGIYMLGMVARFAEGLGWIPPETCNCSECKGGPVKYVYCEFVPDMWDEIESYLNEHYEVEGAYWGPSEQSDWGLWPIEEENQ